MSAHIRNFSWNRVKLSTLTYGELDQLKRKSKKNMPVIMGSTYMTNLG
jgi:hypothetical protein